VLSERHAANKMLLLGKDAAQAQLVAQHEQDLSERDRANKEILAKYDQVGVLMVLKTWFWKQ